VAESDLIKLYSGRILELASSIPHIGRLDAPQGTARCRSPQCGSTVTVDVVLSDGYVTEFAQDVKACALGQAAASVVGQHIVGCTVDQIRHARDELQAMLQADGNGPTAPFEDLQVLLPARAFANRHSSILLTLNASLEAAENASRADCA